MSWLPCDATSPSRPYAIRGRVVAITSDGGTEHIEACRSGRRVAPYQAYGGGDQVRVILTVSAEKVHTIGG